ncbi:MAG TPA: PIN domain-containing protein [Candidatus Sulfomarinibacteraceae bacterium]|nr:PIN domain-containing protein [Candidatus Sulfomarinibacteraceae bacterium]
MILVDASGILAALDSGERHHRAALEVLKGRGSRLLSPMILAELDYLLAARAGGRAQRAFLQDVADGVYRLEPFTADDVREALTILDQYRDLDLGLADASVVVLARRHDTLDLLTLDERHFRAVLGPGGRPFRILPADATAA